VQSREGEGSTFTLSLPLANSGPRPSAPRPASEVTSAEISAPM
jgi:hypothetical protein